MNLRVTNQLNMAGACINLAIRPDYEPIWKNQPPLDFTDDFGKLQADYAAVTGKAALVEQATGGAGDMKVATETALEEAAFILARALASHFKKTGDLDNLAKVDLTKSAIQKLKTQDLAAKGTDIRDLGTVAVAQPDAAKRGVTPERIATLTGAIAAFTGVMNAPRGQIVNRNTLLKEIETDTASLLEQLNDLDDLVLQFDGSEVGRRFNEAWKRARVIVDSGHTTTATSEAPAATAPAPAAK